ncbi:MAG: hypothetical protein K6G55_04540 [Selenomonadaceae bacterium]|nr:hypothetical protein [Selenomonadaceae bacterium]
MGIDEQIDEYFNKEEKLHRLREKLFNLVGYRPKSDVENEISNLCQKHEQRVAEINRQHENELQKLREWHQTNLQQTKDQYEAQINQKENELAEFRAAVNEKLEAAERDRAELNRWQSDYGDFEKAYANFSALSQKHKDAVAGIFGGSDTPIDFFCGGVQKGHLEQLWDYISDELNAGDINEQEATKLSQLFDFSFNAVNRSQREPLFRRLNVNEQSAFDLDTMTRTSDSPQLGQVKRLVFAGFAHEVTGSVIKRSLVILE